MYPLSTSPDSRAEEAVVAPPWASGSHRWKGNMALLMPSPVTISPAHTVRGTRYSPVSASLATASAMEGISR